MQDWRTKLSRMEKVIHTMGKVLAWTQLRIAEQQSAAETAELIDYGAGLPGYAAVLFDQAETYAEQVEQDWRVFTEAASTKLQRD